MKIELMNLLVNELNDIDTIKNMISIYDNIPEEDIKKILDEAKKCGYNGNALKLATDKDVLEQRTIEEQIKLMYTMHTLEKYKYRYGAFEIAIDKNVLENRTTDEQIQLMNSYVKKGELTHSDNLNKINDLKELKKYVCNLQKVYGNDTDIKIKDVVKLYK